MSPKEMGLVDERADLHLHTTASDGRWTPEQLIDEVQQAGIDLFAVTDHDSLGSLAEIADRVRSSGLGFLPGVELSARVDGQLYHLLAYGFDPSHADLVTLAAENSARLNSADHDLIRLLIEAGFPIALEDYAAYTWDRRRGGWKSLNFLIDGGFCQGTRDYFDQLLSDIARPEPDFPSVEKVVEVVQRAGGVVVLAHPGSRFYRGLDIRGLDQLVEMGVEGLECYACYHSDASTRQFVDYCQSRNLLSTGGSDCHGGFVGRSMGVPRVRVSELRLGGLEERVIT